MKWIARVFVFTATLIFGTFVASLFVTNHSTIADEMVAPVQLDHTWSCKKGKGLAPAKTPMRAEDLLGTWKGTWGHNYGECTILINRVEGNAFHGKLRKQGTEVLLQGTFRPESRTVYFEETKVVRLGARTSEWSLGKNTGFISPDGLILVGTGHDKWGDYGWTASKH